MPERRRGLAKREESSRYADWSVMAIVAAGGPRSGRRTIPHRSTTCSLRGETSPEAEPPIGRRILTLIAVGETASGGIDHLAELQRQVKPPARLTISTPLSGRYRASTAAVSTSTGCDGSTESDGGLAGHPARSVLVIPAAMASGRRNTGRITSRHRTLSPTCGVQQDDGGLASAGPAHRTPRLTHGSSRGSSLPAKTLRRGRRTAPMWYHTWRGSRTRMVRSSMPHTSPITPAG